TCLGESSTRMGDLLGSPRVASLLFPFLTQRVSDSEQKSPTAWCYCTNSSFFPISSRFYVQIHGCSVRSTFSMVKSSRTGSSKRKQESGHMAATTVGRLGSPCADEVGSNRTRT